MKLSEILKEQSLKYVVYKVTGPYTDKVYYGYSTQGNIRHHFFKQAEMEGDRGTSRMVAANDGDAQSLKVTPIGEYDTQEEAQLERNDERWKDQALSVTKPSAYPPLPKTGELFPEKVAEKKKMAAAYLSTASVADAMQIGRPNFTVNTLKALAMQYGRDQILRDKDRLSANDFARKYQL